MFGDCAQSDTALELLFQRRLDIGVAQQDGGRSILVRKRLVLDGHPAVRIGAVRPFEEIDQRRRPLVVPVLVLIGLAVDRFAAHLGQFQNFIDFDFGLQRDDFAT